jgi:type VII secretion protein EccE
VTIRIALALLAIVLAAMAYPWQSTPDRWVVGIAVIVVLAAFAWWRGMFVTTMIGRLLAMARRRGAQPAAGRADRMTVLVKVEDPAGVGLSLALIAGYVDRFGVRCASVRVTSRDQVGTRTTWIGMTLAATDNLAALQARSPELPLYDTTEIVGRRLADHLRETGLEAAIVDQAAAPLPGSGKEKWTSVTDGAGVATAYGVRVDERLGERFAEVSAQPLETWAVLEFSGTAAHPTVAAACAFRSAEPLSGFPVDGLIAQRGVQRPLLESLNPTSPIRIDVAAVPLPEGLLDSITWRVGSSNTASVQQTRL